MQNSRYLKNLKIRDKYMTVSHGLTDCCTFFSLSLSFFFNVCHSVGVWPTALKLGCVTNFDMLFLVMGFISLVDEIKVMLILT